MATYISQPDETNSKDTYIRNDAYANTNYGTNVSLPLGCTGADVSFKRILIAFDFSSIPSGATVTSATLSLYLTSETSDNAKTANVYRLIRNWVESQATFNIASTGVNWGSPGADSIVSDINSTVVGSKAFTTTEAVGFKDFSLDTTIVQGMINGTYNNYGFLIWISESAINMLWTFASSSNATAANRPKMTIEYTLPGGTNIAWW